MIRAMPLILLALASSTATARFPKKVSLTPKSETVTVSTREWGSSSRHDPLVAELEMEWCLTFDVCSEEEFEDHTGESLPHSDDEERTRILARSQCVLQQDRAQEHCDSYTAALAAMRLACDALFTLPTPTNPEEQSRMEDQCKSAQAAESDARTDADSAYELASDVCNLANATVDGCDALHPYGYYP